MGPIWFHMGTHMGPTWAAHMGPIWVMQPGFIWVPYGLARIEPIWAPSAQQTFYIGPTSARCGLPYRPDVGCRHRSYLESATRLDIGPMSAQCINTTFCRHRSYIGFPYRPDVGFRHRPYVESATRLDVGPMSAQCIRHSADMLPILQHFPNVDHGHKFYIGLM